MIPLRDTVPTKNYPIVNNTIIGVNVLIFLYQVTQGVGLEKFIYIYGLVPARYSIPQISAYFTTPQQIFSFISLIFWKFRPLSFLESGLFCNFSMPPAATAG
jgi:membrane associated rhomboid family serine protease